MRKLCYLAFALVLVSWSCQNQTPTTPEQEQTTNLKEQILNKMNAINEKLNSKEFSLAKRGGSAETAHLFLNEMHILTFDEVAGLHGGSIIVLSASRWVANDTRREAEGTNLTWLNDRSFGTTSSGVEQSETKAAIQTAMRNKYDKFLNTNKTINALRLRKRNARGADPTIFDELFGLDPDGNQSNGNPFLADISQAGFYPGSLFDAVGGPGGKEGILAFAVSFIFVDDISGVPTDIDNNGRLDRALVEVYYNDFFGDPSGSRAGNPWGIDADLPAIDIQTVAIHENGHSLDIGHLDFPECVPSVMASFYMGKFQTLDDCTKANLVEEYSSWPNP